MEEGERGMGMMVYALEHRRAGGALGGTRFFRWRLREVIIRRTGSEERRAGPKACVFAAASSCDLHSGEFVPERPASLEIKREGT